MMKEVSEVKETAAEINGLKNKFTEVWLDFLFDSNVLTDTMLL